MATRLPIVNQDRASSLRKDGHRNWVHPADVSGRFTTLRRIGFAVLIAIYAITPWIQVGGDDRILEQIARADLRLSVTLTGHCENRIRANGKATVNLARQMNAQKRTRRIRNRID